MRTNVRAASMALPCPGRPYWHRTTTLTEVLTLPAIAA
jgi:hypothetical protein